MTVQHLKKQRRYDDWKDIIDYETFWILMFSTMVLSSGIFALAAIAQNHPYAFP
jgi:cytochrome c biogenesis factor